MVYQILISTMYLHFSNFFLVFMIVGLVGEAVVIVQDFRLLIPPLFLSPDNTKALSGERHTIRARKKPFFLCQTGPKRLALRLFFKSGGDRSWREYN